MNKKGIATQSNADIFASCAEITVDGKKYLVERHFSGNRDIKKAVFSIVENEAKRDKICVNA